MSRIIVAGAGGAGLATAAFLQQGGHEVTLVERSSWHDAPRGYGLQLAPNAVRILDRLTGVGETLRRKGVEIRHVVVGRADKGEVVTKFSLGAARKKASAVPHLAVRRADLIAALRGSCEFAEMRNSDRAPSGQSPKINIRECSRVTGITEGAAGVTCQIFSEGSQEFQYLECDWLVGADGRHSSVRGLLTNSANVVHKHTVWRACEPPDPALNRLFLRTTGPENTPGDSVGVWPFPGGNTVIYPVDRSGSLNVVLIFRSSLDAQEEGTTRRVDQLPERALPEILRVGLGEVRFRAYPLSYFHRPMWTRHAKRIICIGDAAHAIVPHLAQGAAMALEDAWQLGDCLNSGGGLTSQEVTSKFYRERLQRVARVARSSRWQGRLMHAPAPMDTIIRLVTSCLTRESMGTRFGWLFDGP